MGDIMKPKAMAMPTVMTTPTALPQPDDAAVKQQAVRDAAVASAEGTSSASTGLTVSKLGDVAKAIRRYGSAGGAATPAATGGSPPPSTVVG